MAGQIDKRRSFRLDFEITATFKADQRQDHLSTSTTLNVSAVGLCMICKDSLTKGQEIMLTMRLPNEEKVEFDVKVIWIKEEFTIKGKEYTTGVKIIENNMPGAAKFVKYYASQFMASYNKIVENKDESKS